MTTQPRIAAILDFWFLPPGHRERGSMRKAWFEKNPEFDAAIAARFMGDVEAALAGQNAPWAETPAGALALLILLDQFPRNLFRGQARAFAGDALARAVADRLVGSGGDGVLAPIERMFVYLPFEHGEELADQDRSVALFMGLPEMPARASLIDYAERHRQVIRRFGRFPHRNAALGRTSTSAELAYLAEPGSGF